MNDFYFLYDLKGMFKCGAQHRQELHSTLDELDGPSEYMLGRMGEGDSQETLKIQQKWRLYMDTAQSLDCMYMHIYIYVFVHICMYVYVRIYICIYIYTNINMYVYVHIYMCIYIYTNTINYTFI